MLGGLLSPTTLASSSGSLSEGTSLLGAELTRSTLPAKVEAQRLEQLADARRAMLRAPKDADAVVWYGRRVAYLGRYREAIEVYDRGIELFPSDARFLRHRGHRWISVRELDRAVEDLARAAQLVVGTADEVEPDGLPNALGIPRSTLQGNIWYHLALAHSLRGDQLRALPAWQRCLDLARNDDSRVAASYWLYLTLRRLGLETEGQRLLEKIDEEMDVIENHSYHHLLLAFRAGGRPVEQVGESGTDQEPGVRDATRAYGFATFAWLEGERERAVDALHAVLEGGSWAAFGYIAAEADLARLRQPRTMAVTVDDLPFMPAAIPASKRRELTESLLAAFEASRIPAAGFVNSGKLWVDGELDSRMIELLELWLDRGFELGNHTATHPDLHRVSVAEFERDILEGETPLRQMIEERGSRLRFFRHPFLHTGLELDDRQRIRDSLAERGYEIAPVTIDPGEWIYARAYENTTELELRERIGLDYLEYMTALVAYYQDQSSRAFGRSIAQVLLVHANRLNADWFSRFVKILEDQQISFVTLDEALRDPAYRSSDSYVGAGGISWIHRWILSAGLDGEVFGSEPDVPKWVKELAGLE